MNERMDFQLKHLFVFTVEEKKSEFLPHFLTMINLYIGKQRIYIFFFYRRKGKNEFSLNAHGKKNK